MKFDSRVVLLLGALNVASGRLLAQTGGAGIAYSSSPGCPDERQFRDELALHLRGPAPKARPIVVDARQLEEHSVAWVRFEDEHGVLAVRELSAPSCAEVVTAAALVVALAIDSRGRPEKIAATKASLAPPSRQIRDLPPVIDEGSASSTVAPSLFLQFGGGAIAHLVISPEPMLGASAFAGLGARRIWDLRAAFVYAASGEVTRDERGAKFTLLAGRLDGCALPLASSARFSLDPCLAIELGAVRSAGVESERYTSTERTALWMAAGPLLRGQVFFDWLRLEGYAGPWFPIVGQQSFVFRSPDGNRSFYEMPLVGLLAGLNLALAIDWPRGGPSSFL